jgi:DNA-binding response OmpR family regulator
MMDNKKKILIVDDDPKILNLSSVILKQEGYQVVQASNGADALKKVVEEQPDLIVVDLILPDMNGAEIIEAARNKCACKAPVIFLTGMITKKEENLEDMDIKIKDKNYTVIAKPYDQIKFLNLVSTQLKQGKK